MKIVNNILNSMCMGSNCGTTATKIILNHYGYQISENMVFGLGSGLGFIYQYYADDETYFLSGKNESLENNIANLLGGSVVTGYFDDEEKAWEMVKGYIDMDIPVILDLSIRYLPYFEPYLESVGGIGFGLHNAVLAGYDEKEQTVLLLDHRWSEPQTISMADLVRSRGAKDSGMDPRNAYRIYLLPEQESVTADKISFAVKLNVHRMKYPFAYKIGLSGLCTFQKELLEIAEQNIAENSANALTTFGMLMEKLGTGGGNFRRIYGRFLREAAEIIQKEEYKEISRRYMDLAGDWKELSFNLINIVKHNNADNRMHLKQITDRIIDKENDCIERLDAI